MNRTQYFDREGRELTRHQALDSRGLIKDGVIVRHRLQMMDAARVVWSDNDAKHHMSCTRFARVHDGTSEPFGLNRPGFRFIDNMNTAARQRAYDAYRQDLENAWRGNDAEGYAETAIGSVCTVLGARYPAHHGSPGHIQRVGSEILCVPDALRERTDAATDVRRARKTKYDPRGRLAGTKEWEEEQEDADDDDSEYEENEQAIVGHTSTHSEGAWRKDSLSQLMRDHQNKMDRLYNQLDHELSETWRRS